MNIHAWAATLILLSLVSVSSAVVVQSTADVRLITEPSGARDLDNGGNTVSGRLIGTNVNSFDNLMVYQFSDLSAVLGLSVSGATVDITVSQGFSNPNHGTMDDLINVSELALPNDGWEKGSSTISGSTNFTDDGSISYQNRVQFLPQFNESEPWLDEGGMAVANIEGAMTLLGSVSGYEQGAAPLTLSFDIDGATAQRWVDSGLAGLVFNATDDGDSRSRFGFVGDAASIDFIEGSGGPSIDLNGDGFLTCGDIDSLTTEIAAGTNSASFDLDGDGAVDGGDLSQWLNDAGSANLASGNAYLVGDNNLNGSVDSTDLGLLLNNFGETSGVAYCGGDLNADGNVDSTDLGLLLNNFGGAAATSTVPEPDGLLLLAFVSCCIAVGRRPRGSRRG